MRPANTAGEEAGETTISSAAAEAPAQTTDQEESAPAASPKEVEQAKAGSSSNFMYDRTLRHRKVMARLRKHLVHEQRTSEMLDKRSHDNLSEGVSIIPEHDLEISRELQNFIRQALNVVKSEIALRTDLTRDASTTELPFSKTSIYEMNGADRELVIQKALENNYYNLFWIF